MPIKRILLPFCDAVGFEPVAEAAFAMGRSLSAQVRGLFAQPSEGLLLLPDETTPVEKLMRKIEKVGRDRADRLRQGQEVFHAYGKHFPDVQAEFAAIDGFARERIACASRLADLSILGSGSHDNASGWQEIRDGVLLGSGRPVLLVPPKGIAAPNFDRVVIAWKEGLETARAIAASQPFLQQAREVHLITVGEGGELNDALGDVEAYLQLHHAEVRSSAVPLAGGTVAEILMRKCEDVGGALLVMGAYSHARWQERIFGGVTEYIMHNARVPVLMAH